MAYVLILASVHRGIPLDVMFILLLKHLITQILCEGSTYYLLFITIKCEIKAKYFTSLSVLVTLMKLQLDWLKVKVRSSGTRLIVRISVPV